MTSGACSQNGGVKEGIQIFVGDTPETWLLERQRDGKC